MIHSFLTRAVFTASLLLASVLVVLAQSATEWVANPSLHQIKPANANENAVVLLDQRRHEFVADEKEGIVLYTSMHKIIRVLKEQGVEMFNKIYVSVPYDAEVKEIKARVITPGGKVVPLPAEKILDEEEDGRLYKKFALEGVEKGSEVEYIATMKRGASFFGLEVFQSPVPCEEARFTLSVPEHLVFTCKGYNGFAMDADTVIGEQRITNGICKDIAVLENEKYAETAPYLKNVQYKLSYNLSKDKDVRLFTWNQLAKNVYDRYTKLEEKEAKAVSGFIKNIKPNGDNEEAKIIAVEDYLKNTISINEEGLSDDADLIEKIVKTKVASHEGFNKLFAACLQQFGVGYQIVFPSKRDDIPLDEKLENYRLIENPVFYFPATGKYLEPTNISFRYPYIQPNWAATKGLFLQNTSIGNFSTAYASFKNIAILPYEQSSHNMEIQLAFNPELDSVLMHSKQVFTGYGASMYRPAFHFLPKDKQEEVTRELMQSVSNSKEIRNMKVANSAFADGYTNKPLTIEGDISSAELFEKAGNKLLLKIGDVIGPQVQMYQEKPRQLPVTIEYPHALDRTIELTIPEGYTIKNPDDLKFYITEKPNEEGTMGFIANYKIEGNKLLINIHEYYKETSYTMQQFDAFQKVINGAADFNKVVLVLEKKK